MGNPRMAFWAAAQLRSDQASRAVFHIERQGFQVYNPQCRPSRRSPRVQPLFPGYLFVWRYRPLALPARHLWRHQRDQVGRCACPHPRGQRAMGEQLDKTKSDFDYAYFVQIGAANNDALFLRHSQHRCARCRLACDQWSVPQKGQT
jgi:Transcription termination factor nusG